MAMDVSSFTQIIFKYAINPMLWVFILLGMLAVALIALKIRKRRRLTYLVAEIVDLGNGKSNINCDMKAGYFGKTSYLKGLWWSGEEVLKTSFNDTIEYFSTEDFQEVNGERGIICYRDPIRRNILFPISRMELKNKELIAAVAPADYTDVAAQIYQDSVKETVDYRDKILQVATWGLVVVFSLVAIVVVVKMVGTQMDKASELILTGSTVGGENCRTMCSEIINVVRGSVGPGAAP